MLKAILTIKERSKGLQINFATEPGKASAKEKEAMAEITKSINSFCWQQHNQRANAQWNAKAVKILDKTLEALWLDSSE